MKKILFSILMMVTCYQLNAQAAVVSLPTFTRDIITMKVHTGVLSYDSYIAISDGTQMYVVEMDALPVTPEKEKTNNSLPTITIVFNRLKEQNYEILTATVGNIGSSVNVTTYILQKK